MFLLLDVKGEMIVNPGGGGKGRSKRKDQARVIGEMGLIRYAPKPLLPTAGPGGRVQRSMRGLRLRGALVKAVAVSLFISRM